MNHFPSRKQRGAAAIEFALVLPLLLVMVLGMIDYGWWLYVYIAAGNAAREGARAATTVAGGCPNGAALSAGTTAAMNYMGLIGMSGYTTVTATCTSVFGSLDPAFAFQLQVNFPRLTGSTIVPMPSASGGQAGFVGVHTSATMRGVQ